MNMSLQKCSSCMIRVVPKADGHCPSCGALITEPRPKDSPPSSETTETSPITSPPTPEKEIQPIIPGSEPIIIMPSRVIAGVALIVGVGLLLAGVMAIVQNDDIAPRWVVLGIIAAIFGPIISLYALTKLFSNKPVLVVDDEGILDNASMACVGLIKWSEITELSTYSEEGITFLVIEVKDPNIVLARRRGIGGAFARFEAGGKDRPPIHIPQTFLSITIADLLEQIKKRYTVPIRQV